MNSYWGGIRLINRVLAVGGLLLFYLALIPPVMGAIVYVPDQGFALKEETRPNFGTVWMAESDFGFRFELQHNEWKVTQFPGPPSGDLQVLKGEGTFVARLDSGFELREGLDWRDAGDRQSQILVVPWTGWEDRAFSDTAGFMGVRIHGETSEPYYGWLRLEHSLVDGTYTVHDWAWNSIPGEPILAGQIPEPKVYALLLGIGVLVFVAGRRRFHLRRKMKNSNET